MTTSQHRPVGAGYRVLVVDDDEAFGHASIRVLGAAGFEVLHASDYRAALTLIESSQPLDLLVTDIVMPERINGLALARMARLRRPNLKVIYVTGYEIPGIEDEALGIVLRKPVDDEGLVDAAIRTIGPIQDAPGPAAALDRAQDPDLRHLGRRE